MPLIKKVREISETLFIKNPHILRCKYYSKRYQCCQLSSGNLAAHGSSYLVLLGSPPDTVRKFPLRKTKTSTPHTLGSFTNNKSETEHHPCYSGLQVQGTADSPASANVFSLYRLSDRMSSFGLNEIIFLV